MFIFIYFVLGDRAKKYCYDLSQRVFFLCSLLEFCGFVVTFRSLSHFEFIVVCGVIKCPSFLVLYVAVQFSQHDVLQRLSCLHYIFLPPFFVD